MPPPATGSGEPLMAIVRSARLLIVTVFEQVDVQVPVVTVTPSVAVDDPTEKVIDGVPWPAVIVPLAIVQL